MSTIKEVRNVRQEVFYGKMAMEYTTTYLWLGYDILRDLVSMNNNTLWHKETARD